MPYLCPGCSKGLVLVSAHPRQNTRVKMEDAFRLFFRGLDPLSPSGEEIAGQPVLSGNLSGRFLAFACFLGNHFGSRQQIGIQRLNLIQQSRLQQDFDLAVNGSNPGASRAICITVEGESTTVSETVVLCRNPASA